MTFLLFTTHLLGQTVIYVSDVYVFGHHISHFRNIKNRPFFHDRFSKRNNSFIQRFVFIQRPAVVYVRYVKNKFHFLHSTTNIRSTKNQFPFFPLQEDFFFFCYHSPLKQDGSDRQTELCAVHESCRYDDILKEFQLS